MAVYCLSDIHGMAGAFHRMLETIRFTDEDTLYVIGDVIDRGERGIALLQELMAMDNAVMLLGNHEYMMLDALRPGATPVEIGRWQRNGCRPTAEAFLKLSPREQKALLDYLKGLPDCLDVTVRGTRYFLVHGFPGENTHDAVWNRPRDASQENPLPGRRLIVGHTPVPFLVATTDEEEEAYFRTLEQENRHVEILKAPGFIDIDCGCGHSAPGCCLGCLRLDDGMEFYVPGRRGFDT